MNAQSILLLYLILFFLKLIWECFLETLNIMHVKKNREQIPTAFNAVMDNETYQKSVNYTLAKEKFTLVTHVLSALFTLCFVLSGALGILDIFIKGLHLDIYTSGILYLLLIFFILQIFSLPFALYSQFIIEEKFGFNKMTMKLFFNDLLKNFLVSLVIAVPLLYLLFFFMNQTGNFWWIWAFLIFTAFQLLIVILYPALIAPLFNKFTPLEEGTLKAKIFKLAEKCRFRTSGIYKMDSSKRSKHSNAYFTGIGKTKRIVLYDTLLNILKEDEITAVLAHEIGHQKGNHNKKLMVLALFESLAGFFIINLLLNYEPLYHAFQISEPGYHTILVLLLFFIAPFTFIFQPLSSLLSRKYEYQADRFSVEATGSGEGLKQALLALSKNNLSNLTPHPLYSFYYYSHPVLTERIKALEQPSADNINS